MGTDKSWVGRSVRRANRRVGVPRGVETCGYVYQRLGGMSVHEKTLKLFDVLWMVCTCCTPHKRSGGTHPSESFFKSSADGKGCHAKNDYGKNLSVKTLSGLQKQCLQVLFTVKTALFRNEKVSSDHRLCKTGF